MSTISYAIRQNQAYWAEPQAQLRLRTPSMGRTVLALPTRRNPQTTKATPSALPQFQPTAPPVGLWTTRSALPQAQVKTTAR